MRAANVRGESKFEIYSEQVLVWWTAVERLVWIVMHIFI